MKRCLHKSDSEQDSCRKYFSSVDFLREDTLVGTSFLRVAAHDDDFGTNAAITYSMSVEQPEYLRVNPVNGWVYVNQPISQVSQNVVELLANTHTHAPPPSIASILMH